LILLGLLLLQPGETAWPVILTKLQSDGWLLLGVGLGATVGQLLLTRAFATGAPARVSVVALSQVAFAMVIESILWQRSYEAATLLGIGMVLGPTVWMLLRRNVRKSESVDGNDV
ncbi:MAG: hypothetical protein ACKPHU_30090, partial [Planctomycetaceae bacterium]